MVREQQIEVMMEIRFREIGKAKCVEIEMVGEVQIRIDCVLGGSNCQADMAFLNKICSREKHESGS